MHVSLQLVWIPFWENKHRPFLYSERPMAAHINSAMCCECVLWHVGRGSGRTSWLRWVHTFKLGLQESVCNQILHARPSQSLNLTFLQPLATFGTATTNAMTGGSKKGKEWFFQPLCFKNSLNVDEGNEKQLGQYGILRQSTLGNALWFWTILHQYTQSIRYTKELIYFFKM